MLHIKRITVQRAMTEDKGIDAAGAIFLQIWVAVMTWIITGAASDK